MIISNEIRIHDAIGNATSIGGTAQQLETLPSYQLALKAAREPNTILVWREDLTLKRPTRHSNH